jgi:arylsulfatase A-like enzyme
LTSREPGAAAPISASRRPLARPRRGPSPLLAVAVAAVVLAAGAALALGGIGSGEPVPSFRQQACSLGGDWLELTRRGYFGPRSGDIAVLPRTPAYQASGSGGWTHSGPWRHLTHVPLVFYGPGVIPSRGAERRRTTLADVAPTLAGLLKGSFATEDGSPLPEIAGFSARRLQAEPLRLIVTIVWDGGGWNVLEQWPGAWPNLRRMMRAGISYTRASVGSSPSVTPATHTTLGTGYFPRRHGITGIPVRDEKGEIVDSFQGGESSRFIRVPTLAERWDEQSGNRALVGMVGYEPWHLGMIGKGAERPGGDKDDAAWLDIETNRWITNARHYRLPAAIRATTGLGKDLGHTDAADGRVDGAWRDNAILDDPARLEETPGFIYYHARVLRNLIRDEGYGEDAVTDLLFTNFKQIDRDGHYYSMHAPEVRDTVVASDEVLGDIVGFLDERVGRGNYVVVVTADHGQQPDAPKVEGYGIDPNEVESDVNAEFGPVLRALWPTEAFLDRDVMRDRQVSIEEVARFIADYRLEDNTQRPDIALAGAGRFEPGDRLYDMAIPSGMLPRLDCGAR